MPRTTSCAFIEIIIEYEMKNNCFASHETLCISNQALDKLICCIKTFL